MTTPSTSLLEPSLLELPAWRALKQHAKEVSKTTLRQLFENDPERGTRYNAEAVGIFLDY
jgi:glucose-6-phosphate isomerase